ncbi:MAG: hypothetical protein M3Y38_08455 [Actinomycetota bacterium]|nr:hypothetical protein [Actinomycetota bacterium]
MGDLGRTAAREMPSSQGGIDSFAQRLPMARPQWRLPFQGGLGYTFDGMDADLVAFILPSAAAVFSQFRRSPRAT